MTNFRAYIDSECRDPDSIMRPTIKSSGARSPTIHTPTLDSDLNNLHMRQIDKHDCVAKAGSMLLRIFYPNEKKMITMTDLDSVKHKANTTDITVHLLRVYFESELSKPILKNHIKYPGNKMPDLKDIHGVAYIVQATDRSRSRHTFLVYQDHILDSANLGPVTNTPDHHKWINTVSTVTPVHTRKNTDEPVTYIKGA